MADIEQTSAPVKEEQVDAPTGSAETNGEEAAVKNETQEAHDTVTTEVDAPEGDGAAQAVVAETEEAADTTTGSKDKKRKSIGGVPEHKSKKLNKKKSMPNLNLACEPGDYYWARLKGYPPWPAIIADEQMLPESLLATRPVSAERADGSLREDFKEGGKNAKDRSYPLMFLGTNEFSWMLNSSLTKLDPEECKSKNTKLSKALSQAYDLAVEQHDIDYFKQILQQFQDDTAAWEAEIRQFEAEAAEKAAAKAEKDAEAKEKKAARKSKGGDGDTEMENADAPKSSKKRKAADGDDSAKAKKTPKITKLNAPKTNGDSTSKKDSSKPKKKVAAPKVDADVEQPEMTEAEKAQAREKHVLYLRHRLQKAFLSSDAAPREDEMSGMNDFFINLESYDDLEPAIIRSTKVHKVLKAIIKLNTVPKDDEYHFKKRSQTMLEAWNKRMESNGDVATKPASEEKSPTTNGNSKAMEDVQPEKAVKQADEIDAKIESVDASKLKQETAKDEVQDTKSGAGEVSAGSAEDKMIES